jgi:hypothetical protein
MIIEEDQPHPADVNAMMTKFMPITLELAAERGMKWSGRLMSICQKDNNGKTKAEREFRAEALRRAWKKFPGDAYPKLLALPDDLNTSGTTH